MDQNLLKNFLVKIEGANNSQSLFLATVNLLRSYPHVLQPDLEAKWIIEFLSAKNFAEWILFSSISFQFKIFLAQALYDRLELCKPLAYILGHTDFCGTKILCKPPVLIPRQETQDWVLYLVDRLLVFQELPLRVLDLCSGSGCIGLVLAKNFPKFQVVGADISDEALFLAKENLSLLDLDNYRLVKSDLFEGLVNNKFDLIVSNPPYIPEQARSSLEKSVVNWEDGLALFAKDMGLCFYKKIVMQVDTFLDRRFDLDFNLVFEFSPEQGLFIENLFLNKRFEFFFDSFEKKRAVFALV